MQSWPLPDEAGVEAEAGELDFISRNVYIEYHSSAASGWLTFVLAF